MNATELSFAQKFDIAFSNAALHWIEDHPQVLRSLAESLNPGARILLQMGGKGNAMEILASIDEVLSDSCWNQYFQDFEFPYFFYSDTDYQNWLHDTGYTAKRIELIPKDMVHNDSEQLRGWLRTTWFPYTNRVPAPMREDFLSAIVSRFLKLKPADSLGRTHVSMMRLEADAVWNIS